MTRPNYDQLPLFPEYAPPVPAEPVEVVISGPLKSAHDDPYSTKNARIDRENQRAMAAHDKADEERSASAATPTGRTMLAGVRQKLARPDGWDGLDRDERLANWDVPANGTVEPKRSRLTRQ